MTRVPLRQRGIALLVALLVVALAAILIASLLDRGELAYARTRNALRGEQANAYAQGLEAYAAEILVKDDDESRGLDTRADIWAQPLPPQTVPGGRIAATMTDLNGCLNLNNLSPDADRYLTWRKMFARLLAIAGADATIADAVEAWLGSDGASSDDAFYLAQTVPYRSAHRHFAHVSEFRLVRGVDSETYARLAPMLCALPPGTRLNVNTASVPVLETLGPSITKAEAESIWQNGEAQYTGSAFLDEWRRQGIDVDTSDVLGTASDYFLARGDVELDGVPFTFFSLIERGNGAIRVIARSRGSDDALAAPMLDRTLAPVER